MGRDELIRYLVSARIKEYSYQWFLSLYDTGLR